jgi:hypothetical protein
MQMAFITREQLIAAIQAWVFDKTKPLGAILHAQKALADDNRQLLEALVQKHLALRRKEPGGGQLSWVAPALEVHVATPVNHRGDGNNPLVVPDIAAVAAGIHFGIFVISCCRFPEHW